MNFNESEMQTELRALARKFARNEILPHIEKDEAGEIFRPELIAKMGELGLVGIPTAEKYGGAGLGYIELTTVIDEIAAVSASYAVTLAVTTLPQVILSLFGTEEQKAKYIPDLASGATIGAFSLSEACAGSDAANLRTSAKREGDHYVLNGTKLWTTQGDSAGVIILFARTGQAGSKGISAFILEKGTPGLSYGKREKKMGLSCSHTMELVLENVRIPVQNLIGKEGDGFGIALNALDGGRINIGAVACGVAQGALNCALSHAQERAQFDKTIIEFQGVSFMLADMATALDASRLMVQRAASLKDTGRKVTLEASMAKLFATDTAMQVTTDAVQILGGSGYTREFPVERYMREAKVLQIFEGTNQIQRVVISRTLARKN